MLHIFKKLHQDLFVVHVLVHYTGEDPLAYQLIVAKDAQVLVKFTILNNNKLQVHSPAHAMLHKVFS